MQYITRQIICSTDIQGMSKIICISPDSLWHSSGCAVLSTEIRVHGLWPYYREITQIWQQWNWSHFTWHTYSWSGDSSHTWNCELWQHYIPRMIASAYENCGRNMHAPKIPTFFWNSSWTCRMVILMVRNQPKYSYHVQNDNTCYDVRALHIQDSWTVIHNYIIVNVSRN